MLYLQIGFTQCFLREHRMFSNLDLFVNEVDKTTEGYFTVLIFQQTNILPPSHLHCTWQLQNNFLQIQISIQLSLVLQSCHRTTTFLQKGHEILHSTDVTVLDLRPRFNFLQIRPRQHIRISVFSYKFLHCLLIGFHCIAEGIC